MSFERAFSSGSAANASAHAHLSKTTVFERDIQPLDCRKELCANMMDRSDD